MDFSILRKNILKTNRIVVAFVLLSWTCIVSISIGFFKTAGINLDINLHIVSHLL